MDYNYSIMKQNSSTTKSNRLLEAFYKAHWSDKLCWGVIIFGIIVRFIQYLSNRALWIDEISLSINIVERSYIELIAPLWHFQNAPIGFLFLEKFAIETFGNNEYALRLFPFIFGVLALILFYFLARNILHKNVTPLAVGLFAVLQPLIYYSAEVKPYSLDVLITITLLLLTLKFGLTELKIKKVILLAISGIIVVWFSFSSIFILASIGLTLLFYIYTTKNIHNLKHIITIGVCWLLSFGSYYYYFLKNSHKSDYLQDFWTKMGAFMPLPPTSQEEISWFYYTFIKLFNYETLGFYFSGIAAIIFVLGVYSLVTNKKFTLLIMLCSPILLAVIASGLGLYPFSIRLILFISPITITLIAEGIYWLSQTIPTKKSVLISTILILLLIEPVCASVGFIFYPIQKQEIRSVFEYIAKNKKETDKIYLYNLSGHAYNYYKPFFNFKEEEIYAGKMKSTDFNTSLQEIEYLKKNNKRIWVVFFFVEEIEGIKENLLILHYLNKQARLLDSYTPEGSSTYLYEFNKNNH